MSFYSLRSRLCCLNLNLNLPRRSPRIQAKSGQAETVRTASTIPGIKDPEKAGYLYMIREREFKRLNEHVYKIGRSYHFEKRFNSYPKDSEILACIFVQDQYKEERNLIKEFDTKFVQRSDIGREYYEGDRQEMLRTFLMFANMLYM